MLPTKGAAVVAIVGLTLFGLAWHTHIGWFYIADAIAWGLIVANLALSGVNMRGLTARRTVLTSGPRDIFEDDVIHLAIEVGNRSFFPKLFMTVLEDCPLAAPGDVEKAFLIGSVAAKGRTLVEYSVRCYRRGVYSFGPVKIETSAPFGLFRARKKLEAPFQVTVYPQSLPVGAMADQGRVESQASLFNAPHHSGEVRGSRDYQPGDYLRNIHWRNSARRGQLMVKELDSPPPRERCTWPSVPALTWAKAGIPPLSTVSKSPPAWRGGHSKRVGPSRCGPPRSRAPSQACTTFWSTWPG